MLAIARCKMATTVKEVKDEVSSDTKEFGDMIEKVSGVRRPRFICPIWLAKVSLPLAKLFLNEEIRLIFNKQTLEILEAGHRNICSVKAQKELNFSCRSLEDSITDSFNWFKKTGIYNFTSDVCSQKLPSTM